MPCHEEVSGSGIQPVKIHYIQPRINDAFQEMKAFESKVIFILNLITLIFI